MIVINYAQVRQFDVANGKGIRTTLFVSGCRFNCKNCFNQDYQNFDYGKLWNRRVEEQFLNMVESPLVEGVSVLGGEPFQQDVLTLYRLFEKIKQRTGKDIWVWTGYTYEQIPPQYECIIQDFVDVIIDGQFMEELKDYRLLWRGSSNQRIIDIKQTLINEEVMLYDSTNV